MNLTLPIRDVVVATPRARIVRVDLKDTSFPFLPGQALHISSQGAEKKRTYSIASAPEDSLRDNCLELLIGVDADGKAGPNLVLEPGALVDIEGPTGRFTFPSSPDETCFVFIAGGTGIAPLRSMMRHALHGPHRQIGLFYSARMPGEFAYEGEMHALAGDSRIELTQTVTRATPADHWTGSRGRIGREHLAPLVHNTETLCFVCGPRAMVDELPKLLQELGVSPEKIKIEEW